MLRTLYKDSERYLKTYWQQFNGLYLSGDGAKKDDDELIWIIGRIDDVINVSGHRIGTAEIESALVEHSAVAEAAVIGKKHDLKGQAVCAFVTLRENYKGTEELVTELKQLVVNKIGALHDPKTFILQLNYLNPQRKIMRRLLRDIAEGKIIGDTTTLMDPLLLIPLKKVRNPGQLKKFI